MSLPTITTSSSPIYITKTSNLLAQAFASDPLERYVTLLTDSLPNDAEIPHERHVRHFESSIVEKVKAGVEISESGNWGGVALWYPPGTTRLFDDTEELVQPMRDLYTSFDAVKQRWLHGRKYWYLNLIARSPSCQEKGIIRALIDPYLQKADEDKHPVWIEATSTHSRDVYAHFGFKEVEQLQIGQGKADETGSLIEGGKGITIFCMIREPTI